MSDSKHEAELRRLNRALRMLSDSNQAVIRATDETALLNEVCRIAVEVGGYRMAWVGLAEDKPAKTMRPVAHRGSPAPYDLREISWDADEKSAVPEATAIRTGRPQIVHDIAIEHDGAHWRDAVLRLGYRSMVSLPMMADGRPLGVLSIYSTDIDAFDVRELEILNELAGDLGYGLNALRIRRERDGATAEVRRQTRMMDAFFEQAVTSIALLDRDCRFVRVNEAFARFYGLEPADFSGKPGSFLDKDGTEIPPAAAAMLEEVSASKSSASRVGVPYVSPLSSSGEVSYWDSTLQPILDEAGEVAFLVFTAKEATELVCAQQALRQVLQHARTTVMHADVVAPAGWREHDDLWLARNMKWSARFEDEAAAQTVMPLALAPGESYYDSWVRAKHPDDGKPMGLMAARAFRAGLSSWEQEFRAFDRGGHLHWFAQVASIVVTAEGRWHVTTINTDITAHRLAEEAVIAREREFRSLAENTPDFIVRWDRALRRVYVNPAFARAIDRRPEELIAQSYGANYSPAIYTGTPESIDLIGAKIREVFVTSEAAELEVPWTTVNGRRIYSIRFVPEFDHHGTLLTVLGISRDITALKETEQQIRALADNSPDLIARYDRNHRALYINRPVEKLMGVPTAHIVGRRLEELARMLQPGFADPEVRVLNQMIDQAFATSRIAEADVPLRALGREIILNVRMIPEADESGHVASVLTTGRDVTALKRAEHERQVHLQFWESMDRVNRAIQGTSDLEQMLHDVLDVVLDLFGCDRAWLAYPCDPEAPEWQVMMERTRDGYSREGASREPVPMDAEIAAATCALLAAEGPVTFGRQSEKPVPAAARAARVQSIIAAAVHPKVDRPYLFGLHQCSHERVWTSGEKILFREIGRRMADALTSLITVRSLRESERRMEEAQRIAHVGHWDCDLISRQFRWADETYRIFGLEPQACAITCDRFQTFIHPDDRAAAMLALNDAAKGSGRYDAEYRIVRPGGEVRVVHARGHVLRTDGDRAARIFGTLQDITESKRTQEALALFRSLIDHTNVGIEVIDPETGRILDVNDTTCRAHGYTREELLTLNVGDLNPEMMRARWREAAAHLREVGYEVSEAQHRRKDGSIFPVEVSATFIRLDREYLLAVVHDITERRRGEEALWESQARLEIANRATRIGPWDWNLLTNEVHFSREWKRQLGYEEHEIGGGYSEWESRLHPDDRERVVSQLHAYLAGKQSDYEVEFRLRHRNGSYRWIFTRAEILRDAGGKVVRVIGCHVDVTARKQAQEELRESQQAYAKLVNTVDGIVWELDVPTFRFTFVSPQAERILGYPVAAWLNGPTFWEDHLHPDDRNAALNFCRHATSAQREHDFYYRMIAADGRTVWLHDIVTVVVEGGSPAKLRGIMVDVTAAKDAEEALRWRTALFEAQVDSGLDAILVVDSNGKKILQNRRLAELWNIPPHIADDPDDRAQLMFVASRTKNPREFTEKVAHLYAHRDAVSRDEIAVVDGRVLDRYTAPVRDQSGKYYGRIWTFRDVTATKQLEEQLRQSQKMEAVGRLAGGIAHDFNNLLTVIQLQASMLLDEPEAAPGIGQSIGQIMDAAQRAAILTRRLLTFSRRQVKEAQPLDLGEVVGNMIKLAGRVLGEDISVETHLGSGLPAVYADPGMMEQVLMNLLINARDAMPGGGRLALMLNVANIDAGYASRHATARTGRFVCLAVADTGTGIAPENLTRIFEPFFTTKEIGKGTGLGLAMVFGIVQEHQGWIEVKSEVGRGTTFRIFLPAMEKEQPEQPAGRHLTDVAAGGAETILLVEDDPMVRTLAASALQRRGYRVMEAGSGAEALERWSTNLDAFDLLVTDLIMPGGVSGQQLAETLGQRRPTLRILYTSGYNNESVTHQLQLVPGHNFLPKPYAIADLLAIVRRRLDET